MIDPCLGSRRLVTVHERDHGVKVNWKRLQRLWSEIGQPARQTIPPAPLGDGRGEVPGGDFGAKENGVELAAARRGPGGSPGRNQR